VKNKKNNFTPSDTSKSKKKNENINLNSITNMNNTQKMIPKLDVLNDE